MTAKEAEALLGVLNLLALFGVLIASAVTDILHRKIYNWITFPGIFLGLALGYVGGGLGALPGLNAPGEGFLDRLAGFCVGFGLFALFSVARAVGPGDAKLMGAVGALTGLGFTIWAMFWGSLVGALIATWVLVMRGQFLRALGRSFLRALRIGRDPDADASPEEAPEKTRIPYGVALSFGAMIAWFLNSPG